MPVAAEIALRILKWAWPFLLAFGVWGWQETRLIACHLSEAVSHKRETVLQSKLDTAKKQTAEKQRLLDDAHQRATDLALLYAGMLPKADQAKRAQEEKDHAEIVALQSRISALSAAPTLHFSGLAAGMLDDISAFANGRDATAPEARPAPVPATPEVVFSERVIVQYDRDAAAAYRDAVNKLNVCRNLYNDARNAQLQVNK